MLLSLATDKLVRVGLKNVLSPLCLELKTDSAPEHQECGEHPTVPGNGAKGIYVLVASVETKVFTY